MQCLKSGVSISSSSLFFTLHNGIAHSCYHFSLVVQVWCSTGDMTQYPETISFLRGRGYIYSQVGCYITPLYTTMLIRG